MSSFSSYPTGVTSCLVMADQLANALEMLIKRGDMKKAADILEQGCSKKREQKPSKLCLATNVSSYIAKLFVAHYGLSASVGHNAL